MLNPSEEVQQNPTKFVHQEISLNIGIGSEIADLSKNSTNQKQVEINQLEAQSANFCCLSLNLYGKASKDMENEHQDSGCERLKRHRREVAGRVMIPDEWGQEEQLKDWVDCSSFDVLLVPSGIGSAREALVAEGRRMGHRGLRVESRC